jgi:acyl carrier protein
MEVEQKVKEIIAKISNIPIERVTLESHMEDDLGADSLDGIEIMLELEEEFLIDIPNEDARKLKYVGDIVVYIGKRKKEAK